MLKINFYRILLLLCASGVAACAQFAEVDRSEVNRPSMNFQNKAFAPNTTPLTNLKASGQLGVGSCTVCSH